MRKFRLLAGAALISVLGFSASAMADGMPQDVHVKDGKPAPAPVREAAPTDYESALDKALKDIADEQAPPPEAAPVAPVQADAPKKEPPPFREVRAVENSSFLGLSVGLYDAFDSEKSPAFNIEYQPAIRIAGFVQPLIGAMATGQGAMYGYAGLGFPLKLGSRLVFTPSVSAGAYREGAGKDLGQTIAYSAGAEIGWRLDNDARVGLRGFVITNGDSSDHNDRTEIVSLFYSTPLGNFRSKGDK